MRLTIDPMSVTVRGSHLGPGGCSLTGVAAGADCRYQFGLVGNDYLSIGYMPGQPDLEALSSLTVLSRILFER